MTVVPSGQDREGGGARNAPPPSVHDQFLRATIDVVATLGYEAAQADHIVQAAGLSRSAFYRHFGGKHRAVLVAARRVLDDLEATIRTAAPGGGTRSRVRPPTGLQALAGALAADPPAAAVLFLEAPAAGADAQPLRVDLLRLLAGTLDDRGARGPDDPSVGPLHLTRADGFSRALRAGALHHVLHSRIARGDTAGLPGQVPEIATALADLRRPPS